MGQRLRFGPKGQHSKAQGNALGNRSRGLSSPERQRRERFGVEESGVSETKERKEKPDS